MFTNLQVKLVVIGKKDLQGKKEQYLKKEQF